MKVNLRHRKHVCFLIFLISTIFFIFTGQFYSLLIVDIEKRTSGNWWTFTNPFINKKLQLCKPDWICSADSNQSHVVRVANTSFGEIESENGDIERGGRWTPSDCRPQWRIALIIILKNRDEQLKIFIRNIIPFLKKQKADFTIFVIEQVGNTLFNRAQAMDAGFVEAQNFGDFDCFIFHDVDMLPINLCNLYRCETDGVRHLGISRNLTSPQIVYENGIGGAVALTKSQFTQINGFTTVFFGWGGEDDDGLNRLMAENITLLRYHPSVGNYLHLSHSEGHKVQRYNEAQSHWQFRKYDGLNTLSYRVVKVTQNAVLTRIQIDIPGPQTDEQIESYLTERRDYLNTTLLEILINKERG